MFCTPLVQLRASCHQQLPGDGCSITKCQGPADKPIPAVPPPPCFCLPCLPAQAPTQGLGSQ